MAKKAKEYECPSCGAKAKEGDQKLPRCPKCADVMQEK